MSATHEEFRQQMAGVVADLALNFALRPDEEVVQALKALRTGFAEEYQKPFSDSAEEADQVAVDLCGLSFNSGTSLSAMAA
jgi:hypothetical protein